MSWFWISSRGRPVTTMTPLFVGSAITRYEPTSLMETEATEESFSAPAISASWAPLSVCSDPASESPSAVFATTPLKPVTGLETTKSTPAGGAELFASTFCAVADDGGNASVTRTSWCALLASFWSS